MNTQDWSPLGWTGWIAVQGTLKSLLQQHSSKASILQHSAFFRVQLSHPCMATGKTIALMWRTFVGTIMSLLSNMLTWFGIHFLPMSKHLLISWLQSPSAVIFRLKNINSKEHVFLSFTSCRVTSKIQTVYGYIISRREYSASNISDTIPFALAHLKLIIMENKVFSSFVTLGKHLSYSLAKLSGIFFFFF